MASDVLVDPITFSKPNKSRRRFLVPIIVALVVAIVGIVYLLTNAYTTVRIYPKVNVNANGFYLTTLNRPFVPRGTNFVRLAQSSTGVTYHSVFEPGQYNPANIKTSLTGMKNSGYNVVRVFIDPGEFTAQSHGISSGVSSNEPIRAAYMANVIDFIQQARSMGIYTLPIIDGVPANTYYYKLAGSPSGNILGRNVVYLDPRYVQAKELYVKEFIKAIPASARTTVLAYQTDNEVFFEGNQPPFSTMSGTLTSLDGVPYDMSKPDRRQQAADANLVIYTHRMKAAITSVDPTGLLTLGFFTNNAVGKTAFSGTQAYCSDKCSGSVNYMIPGRPAAVSTFGKADFIDMHANSTGPNYNLKNDLASSEYSLFQKPYLIGEFGTEKAAYGNNITKAAAGMKNFQVASCSLNAKGWLFWTWDTDLTTSLAHQATLYSLADNNGAINGQLAPVVRPDPCK